MTIEEIEFQLYLQLYFSCIYKYPIFQYKPQLWKFFKQHCAILITPLSLALLEFILIVFSSPH